MSGASDIGDKLRASVARRFFAKVEIPSLFGCWTWTGAGRGGHQPWDKGGDYGHLKIANINFYVHHVVLWLVRRRIPRGHVVDHVCRNRRCVNPLHVEVVTAAENHRRSVSVRGCYDKLPPASEAHAVW